MTEETRPPPRRVLADPEYLDQLLLQMEEGSVIPIVGPELVVVPHDGKEVTLVEYLARRVADHFDLTDRLPPTFSFSDVVAAYKRQGDAEEIYPRIVTFLKQEPFPIPRALQQLAEIRHFRLFVTTTFDSLLTQALDQVRYSGARRTREIVFPGKGNADLDPDWKQGTQTTVYYLFGRAAAAPDYVVTEEDTLEFLTALSAPGIAKLLFDELRQNQLLILGCSFPDWLSRFFIRLAKRERLSGKRVSDLIADSTSHMDRNLAVFLDQFTKRTRVYSGSATQFVNELWKRWRERFGGQETAAAAVPTAPRPEIPEDAIFISYAREDEAAATQIWQGLSAVTDVWMDRAPSGGLDPGDAWARLIKRRINRCSLFVPIISRHTASLSRSFFHREWNQAADRLREIAQGTPFIIPVIIDDTPEGVGGVPEEFWDPHVSRLPGGTVTPEFIHAVLTRLRRVRGPDRVSA